MSLTLLIDEDREQKPGMVRFRCTKCHMASTASEAEWRESGSPRKVPCPGCLSMSVLRTEEKRKMRAVQILQKMGERGMRVETRALIERLEAAQVQAKAARAAFQAEHGFDPMSRKLPFGTKSTRKEVLLEVGDPRATEVVRVRSLDRERRDYSILLDAVDLESGRVKWTWTTAKTNRVYATGNLLTIGKKCRELIVPDSGEFVSFDYRQQELRIIAALTENKLLLDLLDHGDVHQATADSLGWSRPKAKTLHYALMYGSTPESLRRRFGLSEPALQAVMKHLPVDKLVEVAERRAKDGRVETLFGTWLEYDVRDQNSRTNFVCQGSGADMLKQGLELIHEKFDLIPAVVVHDAFVFDDVRAFQEPIAGALEVRVGRVAFPVDMKVGKTWAEVTD